MKLLSFRSGGRASFGLFTNRGIVDLGSARLPDLRTALEVVSPDDLRELAERTNNVLAPNSVEFLPPIPRPEKIFCVGYNYRRHVAEIGVAAPTHPSLFVRFPGSLVGHLQPIIRPAISDQFDFEGELAVVIGRAGRNVAVTDALTHVLGYSCFAENSVRDFQRHSSQVTAGKNFERSGAFGPWIVTSDEISDPSQLALSTRLNGALVQSARLDDLIFDVASLVSYISSFTRLEPGDVIATGTPGGIGAVRTPPLWLRPGDKLEVEISVIGALCNEVLAEGTFHG